MFDKLLDCSEKFKIFNFLPNLGFNMNYRNPVLKPMVECVQENPRIVKLFVSGMAAYSSCLTEAAGADCMAFPGMILSPEATKSSQNDQNCGLKSIQNFVVECFQGYFRGIFGALA